MIRLSRCACLVRGFRTPLVKVLLTAALTLTLTLIGASSPLARAASPATAPPLLAYVAEAKAGSSLRLFDPARHTTEDVLPFTEPPTAVIWRLDRAAVATVNADGVFLSDYHKKPVVPEPIGDAAPKGVSVQDGWFAADGHTLLLVASKNDLRGNPVCGLYAVPVQGAWKLQDKPAPVNANDDCLAFADANRVRFLSVSSALLLHEQVCASAQGICGKKTDPREARLMPALKKLSHDVEGVALADPGTTRHLLAFGVAYGDTPHLTDAIQLVQRDSLTATRLAVKSGKQVQLGLAGNLALIAGEYSGRNPVVVDLDSGNTLFTGKGFGAVWVPATGAGR